MSQKDDTALITEVTQLQEQWLTDCPQVDCDGILPVHRAIMTCDTCGEMYERTGVYAALSQY